MGRIFKKNIGLIPLVFLASPLIVFAQTLPTNILTQPYQVVGLVCGIMNWMFWGLIILSIIMTLVAAYTYATSSGEGEKVAKANKTLLYVAIAVAVAIIAKGFPSIIASLISPGSSVNACEVSYSTITFPTGN